MTAALWRLPVAMRRPYTGSAGLRPGRSAACSARASTGSARAERGTTRDRGTAGRTGPGGEGMAPRIEDALGWLSGQRGAMEALLERLVAQNSFTQHRAGVEAVANLAAGQLRALALDVEVKGSARYGPHVLFSTRSGAGAPGFLLGHTDTVFPPGTFEGLRRDGDRSSGPGAFHLKGGIVVM